MWKRVIRVTREHGGGEGGVRREIWDVRERWQA